MKLKVTYLGNSAQAAEYILFSHDFELVQIICEQGRTNEDLVTFSLVRGIPIVQIAEKNDLCLEVGKSPCDFFVMFSFGIKLPQTITNSFEIYNIHSGYLPDYKGRHPTHWATVNNERYIGITLHRVVSEIDAGEIIDRVTVPYYFWMMEQNLGQALAEKIPQLLESLLEYKLGKRLPICNSGGQYYKPVVESDKIILATDSYTDIFNKIRAQSKYRGAAFAVSDAISIWVKNARFIYKTAKIERKFYVEDSYLYLYIRENVWLKTNRFEIVEANEI